MKWLKHAFAVDPPGPAEVTELQAQVVDRVCREIVRRHLTTPALLFLETARPLNYLSSQVMHFFLPFASVLTDQQQYTAFADFLAQRGSVDYLNDKLVQMEDRSPKRNQPKTEKTPSE